MCAQRAVVFLLALWPGWATAGVAAQSWAGMRVGMDTFGGGMGGALEARLGSELSSVVAARGRATTWSRRTGADLGLGWELEAGLPIPWGAWTVGPAATYGRFHPGLEGDYWGSGTGGVAVSRGALAEGPRFDGYLGLGIGVHVGGDTAWPGPRLRCAWVLDGRFRVGIDLSMPQGTAVLEVGVALGAVLWRKDRTAE